MSSSYAKTKDILALKEFFRLDHFWGKIAFLKKNFVVDDFEEGVGLGP